MKKLMIAAAIVCAAAFAQAGAVNWKIQAVTDPTDASGESYLAGNGIAYLFYAADVDSDMIDAIKGGTFTATYAGDALANSADLDLEFTLGQISKNGAVTGLDGSTSLISVVFNGESAEKSGFYFVSDPVTQSLPTSTAGKPFTYTYGNNTGTWQSIPEPTSGLLLLLGVAGLSLRRRRA